MSDEAPDLLTVARWTRSAQRHRRRLTRSVTQDLGDGYSVLLSIAVLGAIVYQLLIGTGGGGVHGLPGLERGLPLPLSSQWLATALLLACGAAAVGALRRLGPVFLRPEQVAWWLPLPGGRRRLLTRVLVRAVLVSGTIGLAGGVLVVVLLGGGAAGLLSWGLLGVGTAVTAVTAVAHTQVGRSSLPPARLVLLVPATVALGLAVTVGPQASPLADRVLPALGAAMLAGSAAVLALTVAPHLEAVPDIEMSETSRRAFGLSVAGLSLDTREIGRLMAPEPRRPGRSSQMLLARAGGRFAGPRAAALRTVLGVVQADALLLSRQRWRLAQVGVGAALTGLLLMPAAHGVLRTGVMLCAAVVATVAVADPARRCALDGGPDNSWPASPRWVRAGHLVLPSLLLTAWGTVLGVVLTVAGAASGGWPGWLLGTGMLSGVGWGAVALRSGTRAAPDWSDFVASPVGPIPQGYLRSLSQGPDTGALVAWPLTMVLLGAGTGPRLLAAQAAVSGFAVVLALWGQGED